MMLANRLLLHRWGKPIVVTMCALPFAWLLYGAIAGQLGANPGERLVRSTGDWTLRFLCLTLAVTPMRHWTSWSALARYRRSLGLTAYCYALTHLLAYSWLDMGLELEDITSDIAKRPFILVGCSAFVLLTPMALTSTNAVIRWMGARRWQLLHRAIYAIAVLAIVHFFWMRSGKRQYDEVLVYGGIVLLLLGWRIRNVWAHRSRSAWSAGRGASS